MKYVLALLFVLTFGASVHASEPVNGNEWRWAEINGIGKDWDKRGGRANVQMKDGKISAQLMLEDNSGAPFLFEGNNGALYEISGTYRLGKPGHVQEGTVNATVTTLHSDYGDHVPNKGTYSKALIPEAFRFSFGMYRETIFLSDGIKVIGLMKLTK